MQKELSIPIISVFVVAVHALLLLLLAYSDVFSINLPPKPSSTQRPLLVQTVALTPPRQETPQITSLPHEKNQSVEKEIIPLPPMEKTALGKNIAEEEKKAFPKAPQKAKEKKIPPSLQAKDIKANSPQKKSPASNLTKKEQSKSQEQQKKLLDKAKESMAKIAQKIPKESTQLKSLKEIGDLKIETGTLQETHMTAQETYYRQELSARLKLLLELPEYGEVKLKLTLERIGKVAKLVVTNTESELNQRYIEKTLPTLKFPPFGNNFGEANEYTFSITLRNE